MIQSLSIRNFKVLREVDFDLQPLTVIVGPNASGKSSILQAIALLSAWLRGNRNRAMIEPAIKRSTGVTTISCTVKIGTETGHCTANLSTMTLDQGGCELTWNYNFLNLEAKKLAEPSYPNDTALNLPPDGRGLSSVLAGFRLEYPDIFSRIVEQLRSIIPQLLDVRIRRVKIDSGQIGNELIFDFQAAEAIPAYDVSEGTLLTLGVLTALSTTNSPQAVLVDDIERGLHPRALKDYIAQIRSLQKQDPELQIIATSHSPYLLDYIQAEEILLTSLDDDGYAVVKPLTDHPEYERWKDLMAPGEFWSHVGEDWITQEKKATA